MMTKAETLRYNIDMAVSRGPDLVAYPIESEYFDTEAEALKFAEEARGQRIMDLIRNPMVCASEMEYRYIAVSPDEVIIAWLNEISDIRGLVRQIRVY